MSLALGFYCFRWLANISKMVHPKADIGPEAGGKRVLCVCVCVCV
jgi:hypothetical protein